MVAICLHVSYPHLLHKDPREIVAPPPDPELDTSDAGSLDSSNTDEDVEGVEESEEGGQGAAGEDSMNVELRKGSYAICHGRLQSVCGDLCRDVLGGWTSSDIRKAVQCPHSRINILLI